MNQARLIPKLCRLQNKIIKVGVEAKYSESNTAVLIFRAAHRCEINDSILPYEILMDSWGGKQITILYVRKP